MFNSEDLQRKIQNLHRDAEERDAARRAANLNLPYVNIAQVPLSLEALRIVKQEEARRAGLAVVEMKADRLAIVLVDPRRPETKEALQELETRGYHSRFYIASQSGLEELWENYKHIPPEESGITGKFEIEKNSFEAAIKELTNFETAKTALASYNYKEAGITKLFQIILAAAIANKASDIHLEAEEKKAKVRLRVDGILHDIFAEIPGKNYIALIARLKLLSGLKINVHSEAQDGRFTIKLPGKEIEVRVSLIPAEFGETAVLRILDPDSINVALTGLGLRSDDLALVEEELKRPNGMILNTGPTGSGKTTSLYAFLRHIANPEIKIITVEDPVEYRIAGIEQTQVDAEAGYTFANGLRSILRQDPDVILIGEIRDQETADIALQASLTGHLVFSTLHTNDAAGAVPRLIDLGVKAISIGPALSLVIAQRLVRKLCVCKKERPLTDEERVQLEKFFATLPQKVKHDVLENAKFYEPQGCEICSGVGYKGRQGIFEFLRITKDAGEAIAKDASWTELKRLAAGEGMVTMQQDGILKALAGITSLEEVKEETGELIW